MRSQEPLSSRANDARVELALPQATSTTESPISGTRRGISWRSVASGAVGIASKSSATARARRLSSDGDAPAAAYHCL
jgi:hypothetical protein